MVTEGLATVTREASFISAANVPALIVWLKSESEAARTIPPNKANPAIDKQIADIFVFTLIASPNNFILLVFIFFL